MQDLGLLKGDTKHYDWGGTSYIPSLLQIENPHLKPFAEYWLGTHPQAHCSIELNNGASVLLNDFINTHPEYFLGQQVFREFGQLPYLLKLLDVKDMLSIQVHPCKEQAAVDFEAEERNGLALTDPKRNYKDANHKPELMVALSEFYLLHGFQPQDALIKTLESVPEFQDLVSLFRKEGYGPLYRWVMELPQEAVNEILYPLINRIGPLYQKNVLDKTEPHFWAARAAQTFGRPDGIDRGIFSIYFFNILHLQPGEAIFQDAGMPHAYLEGQNVEIMASSDNVLRGGLTNKHIDTQELLKHTRCVPTIPAIIAKDSQQVKQVFVTPARDFELSNYHLQAKEGLGVTATTTEVFLLIHGSVVLKSSQVQIELKPGSVAAVAFAGAQVSIRANENSLLFRASVPG